MHVQRMQVGPNATYRTTETMNVKRCTTLVILAVCFIPLLRGQKSFLDGPDAYLGQTPPGDTPKIFAPGMLADPGMFTMGRVAWSHDGKEFYYIQSDSWEHGKISIKWMRYADHGWSKPAVLFDQFLSPTLSMDEKTMFMRLGNKCCKNVWQSHRTESGWSEPIVFLDQPYDVYDYMPTLSGNAYVGSDPSPDDVKNGSTGAFSLLTVANGVVTVNSLGQPINDKGFNGDLYVAPDESYMIVSARETPTYECELFISFRKRDQTWTVPVSLGPKINDGVAHRWGQYVSPDGKYLFYSHGTSEKDCALYWVRWDKLLKSLRPKGL